MAPRLVAASLLMWQNQKGNYRAQTVSVDPAVLADLQQAAAALLAGEC